MNDPAALPDPVIDHVSAILTLAKQKHEEAMAMVGQPDVIAIPRLRQVLKLLDEVELLAEDAGSYVDGTAMEAAIRELRNQQNTIRASIERLEQLSQRSPWATPWPWITLVVLLMVVAGMVG